MYMINHIFLPPQLPQGDDFNVEFETILLKTTISALLQFQDQITDDQDAVIDLVYVMLDNLRTVRDSSSGAVSEDNLKDILMNICEEGKHSTTY